MSLTPGSTSEAQGPSPIPSTPTQPTSVEAGGRKWSIMSFVKDHWPAFLKKGGESKPETVKLSGQKYTLDELHSKYFTQENVDKLNKNPAFRDFLSDYLKKMCLVMEKGSIKSKEDAAFGLDMIGITQEGELPKNVEINKKTFLSMFAQFCNEPERKEIRELLGMPEVKHTATKEVPNQEEAKKIGLITRGLFALKTGLIAFSQAIYEKVATALASDMEKMYKEWGGEQTARQLVQAFATSPEAGNKALQEFLTTGKISPQEGKLASLKSLLKNKETINNFSVAIGYHQSMSTDPTTILKEIAEARTILQKPVKEQEEARSKSWLVRTLVGSTQTGVTATSLRRERRQFTPRTVEEGENLALERYKDKKALDPGERYTEISGKSAILKKICQGDAKASNTRDGKAFSNDLKRLNETERADTKKVIIDFVENKDAFLNKLEKGTCSQEEIQSLFEQSQKYFAKANPDRKVNETNLDVHVSEKNLSGTKCAVAHLQGEFKSQEDADAAGEFMLNGEQVQFASVLDGHTTGGVVNYGTGSGAAKCAAEQMEEALRTVFGTTKISDLSDEQVADRFSAVGANLEQRIEQQRETLSTNVSTVCTSLSKESNICKPASSLQNLSDVFNKHHIPEDAQKDFTKFLEQKKKSSESEELNIFRAEGAINLPECVDGKYNPAEVDVFLQRAELRGKLIEIGQIVNYCKGIDIKAQLKQVAEGKGQTEGHIGFKDPIFDFTKMAQTVVKDGAVLTEEGMKQLDSLHSLALETASYASGTMMTCAVKVGKNVWTLNVGDSRITAIEKGNTFLLTEDSEKKTGEKGQKRFVEGFTARGGIEGAHPRQIGDREKIGVSPKPKVMKYPIPKEGVTLVLTCDGVTDVMSSNDIATVSKMEGGLPPSKQAENVVKAAYACGSSDNITAMVLLFPGYAD